MKEFEGFVNGTEVVKEALLELDKINFDIEKYNPIVVKFSKEGSTYVYAISKETKVEVGDSVIVPTGKADNFSIAEVYSTIEHFGTDFIKIIKRFTIESKQREISARSVALNLGNKSKGLLKPYFDNIEKDKKKKLILEKLEAEAELANKMSRFELLAATNPKIGKLLKELEEL